MSDPAKLGDEVKDIVTSFKGVMVARTKWLHGCDRISVEPATLTDGQPQKVQHFDEQRIEVVTPGLIPWKNLGAEGTIPLGAKVRDTVTGFSGIAVSYSQWLGGSNTYSVEPDKLNDKGQPGESCGFDVGRVVLVEEKSVPVSRNAVNTLPGGLPRGEQAAMRRGDR